jgi:hypothetical protein
MREKKEAIHPELAYIPIPKIRTMSLKFTIIGRVLPSTLSPSTNKGQEQQLLGWGGGGTNRQPLFDKMGETSFITLGHQIH